MQELLRYLKLAQITQLVNSKLDLRESLNQVIIAISEEILGCDSIGIFLAQSDGTFHGYIGRPDVINDTRINQIVIDPNTDLLARELVEKRKSIYIPDTSVDKRIDQNMVKLLEIQSMLALPIYHEEEIFGLIQLFAFGTLMKLKDKEIETVEAYVNMAAVAIRNAKLFLLQANLLEQVRNAVVYVDVNGRIIFWNKFAETLYQWNRSEVIGKNIDQVFIFTSSQKKSENIMAEVLKAGYWEDEVIHKRKDGSEIFVYATFTLVKSDDNKSVGMMGIINDITEKKMIETHMVNLERLNLIGEMAAGIGHEVRNPLTTVRGFLQILGSRDKYAEEKEFFELILNELDRANSIITEYLSLAKNKILNYHYQNIKQVINHILPLIQADALLKDKSIELRLEEVPDLFIDEKEITQLIINLVRNALYATKPEGSVTIRTYIEYNAVILSITDQGKGISSEVLHKIGTPFVTTKEDGTGLGLAICYSIANRHNANIHFDTDSSGTTFYVKFKIPGIQAETLS